MEKIYYKFDLNEGYIVGFYNVPEGASYDYDGVIPSEVIDSFEYGGWYKFENGEFVEDAERKAEMIAKKEHETTWEERIDAQVTYTAMMTDTLIEEEV